MVLYLDVKPPFEVLGFFLLNYPDNPNVSSRRTTADRARLSRIRRLPLGQNDLTGGRRSVNANQIGFW
jgi:hypothetical protein